ncbi:hypothetical protein MMC11_004198 [Xylographa trunciseda]|nr:hypothetical protein [Xylographa trunciseda]
MCNDDHHESTEPLGPLQLPHPPDECLSYCASHCVKNHQNSTAYRLACVNAAAQALADIEADVKKATEAIHEAQALEQTRVATGEGRKEAVAALIAAMNISTDSIARLKMNGKIVVAVEEAFPGLVDESRPRPT